MMTYQEPIDMMTRMPSVIRATRSPPCHSACRPYGLSTISVLDAVAAGAATGTATGAGAIAGAASAGGVAAGAMGVVAGAVAGACAAAPPATNTAGNARTTAAANAARRFMLNMLSPCISLIIAQDEWMK